MRRAEQPALRHAVHQRAAHALSVLVLKRSLRPAFAGVENPLFFRPNARMLFGGAKTTIAALLAEFKEAKA